VIDYKKYCASGLLKRACKNLFKKNVKTRNKMMNRFFLIVLILFPIDSVKSQVKVSLISSNVGKESESVRKYRDRWTAKLAAYDGKIYSVLINTDLIFVNKIKFSFKKDFILLSTQFKNYNIAISEASTETYLIKTSNRKYLIMVGAISGAMGKMGNFAMILIFDVSEGVDYKKSKKWICIQEKFDIKKFNDNDKDGFLNLKYKDDDNKEKKYTFRQ
jgi:hypothetical protein